MEQDLLQCFPDKPPRVQARIAEVLDILSQDARVSLTAVSKQLDLPVSTVYEYMAVIKKRLRLETVFLPNPAEIPQARFRCPECKSRNTEPHALHNPATGKVKVTGAQCKDCGAELRRGQLSPTLVRKMEAWRSDRYKVFFGLSAQAVDDNIDYEVLSEERIDELRKEFGDIQDYFTGHPWDVWQEIPLTETNVLKLKCLLQEMETRLQQIGGGPQ